MKNPSKGMIVGFLLLLTRAACATSYDGVGFPTTPFMLPRGFTWVMLVFLFAFILANSLLLRLVWPTITWRAAISTTAWAGVGIALLCVYLSTQIYRPQIQGLTCGRQVFWGWNWERAKDAFISMNVLSIMPVIGGALCLAFYNPTTRLLEVGIIGKWIIGITLVGCFALTVFSLEPQPVMVTILYVLLLCIGAVQASRRFGWRSVAFVGANLLVYLLCLTPFIMRGAFAHGLAPWMSCNRHLGWEIGSYMLAYTRVHHGQLPTGRSIEAVIDQLRPYSDGMPEWEEGEKPVVCPAGQWLDRNPRPYQWNARYAGTTIAALRKLPKPVMLVTCPYHPTRFISSTGLVKAYDAEESIIRVQHY